VNISNFSKHFRGEIECLFSLGIFDVIMEIHRKLTYVWFEFIHFGSVTLVNTIKTTSFIPPSVIKLHLLFAHAFTCFGFLVDGPSDDGLLNNRN
jgi:hypothetical protein